MLLTWQKLAPLIILLDFSAFLFLFIVFAGLSSLVGGAFGVGQVQVRILFAYSSIGH